MKGKRSSIPSKAVEKIRDVECGCSAFDCIMGHRVVGFRLRNASGVLEWEYGLRRGLKHGFERYWSADGVLIYERFFVNGRQHGTAKQWSQGGKLLGVCRLSMGTGIERWLNDDGSVAEESHYVDGLLDGVQRGWTESGRTVYFERYWRKGVLHGIEREWSPAGDLKVGFPKFFLDNRKVSMRRYLLASSRSVRLPHYQMQDDSPNRLSVRRTPKRITEHKGQHAVKRRML